MDNNAHTQIQVRVNGQVGSYHEYSSVSYWESNWQDKYTVNLQAVYFTYLGKATT